MAVLMTAFGPSTLALAAELTRRLFPIMCLSTHRAETRSILGLGKSLTVKQKVCLETDVTQAVTLAWNTLSLHMALPICCNKTIGYSKDAPKRT